MKKRPTWFLLVCVCVCSFPVFRGVFFFIYFFSCFPFSRVSIAGLWVFGLFCPDLVASYEALASLSFHKAAPAGPLQSPLGRFGVCKSAVSFPKTNTLLSLRSRQKELSTRLGSGQIPKKAAIDRSSILPVLKKGEQSNLDLLKNPRKNHSPSS